MKVKAVLAIAALSYASLGMASDKAAYPNEKVAQFVVEKLDVTSLQSAIRPKKEKATKTFADYGFTAQSVDEHEAILEAPGGTRKFYDQDSRPAILWNLRLPCGARAKRWRGKDAKCLPAEKEGFERIV